jgi:hypothetical protein
MSRQSAGSAAVLVISIAGTAAPIRARPTEEKPGLELFIAALLGGLE